MNNSAEKRISGAAYIDRSADFDVINTHMQRFAAAGVCGVSFDEKNRAFRFDGTFENISMLEAELVDFKGLLRGLALSAASWNTPGMKTVTSPYAMSRHGCMFCGTGRSAENLGW